jgi:hypothetical protein
MTTVDSFNPSSFSNSKANIHDIIKKELIQKQGGAAVININK